MEDEKNKIPEEKIEENKIKKDIKKEDTPDKENLTDKMRENPWIISTLALGILALVLLVGNFSGGMTGGTVGIISDVDAGEALLSFANGQGAEAELSGIEDIGDFYEVTLVIEGEDIPLMVTKDGEYFLSGGLVPLNEIPQTTPQKQEPIDWGVFENELPADMASKILSFPTEQSEEYDASMRINEFANYDLIPKTLISFYGAGCGWCTKYHPVLVEAMGKYPEITIYALDLSENKDIAEKYGATGTPANIINGRYFVSGYKSIEDLSKILEALK